MNAARSIAIGFRAPGLPSNVEEIRGAVQPGIAVNIRLRDGRTMTGTVTEAGAEFAAIAIWGAGQVRFPFCDVHSCSIVGRHSASDLAHLRGVQRARYAQKEGAR